MDSLSYRVVGRTLESGGAVSWRGSVNERQGAAFQNFGVFARAEYDESAARVSAGLCGLVGHFSRQYDKRVIVFGMLVLITLAHTLF